MAGLHPVLLSELAVSVLMDRFVLTLSDAALFSAKCKSFSFRKFIASFVFYAGEIYQETFLF